MSNIDTLPVTHAAEGAERYHSLMSTGVRMKDGNYEAADSLAARAHESIYGRFMRDEQPLRFAQRYSYGDRTTMLDDLGADLCPIGHQRELGWHVAQLIEKQRLYDPTFDISDDEVATLMFTSLIHDMGEMTHDEVRQATGAVVGDIPAGQKTPEDRIVEKNVRLFLYDTFFRDVDTSVMQKVEAIIAHEDTSILHELFEAAHESQTLETTLRASEISEQLGWAEGHDVIQLIDNSNGKARATIALGRLVLQDHLERFEEFSYYFHMSELLSATKRDDQIAA